VTIIYFYGQINYLVIYKLPLPLGLRLERALTLTASARPLSHSLVTISEEAASASPFHSYLLVLAASPPYLFFSPSSLDPSSHANSAWLGARANLSFRVSVDLRQGARHGGHGPQGVQVGRVP
jgi:hypothetical protein